jgi:CBS domain containing-hemolysin-like protein
VSVDATEPRGIRASARSAIAHAKSVGRLQKELATLELQQKAQKLGAGAVLGIAAAVIALYALGFALATAAAALALVVDWWLALLIVFGALALITIILGLVAKSQVKKGTPLKPEQAMEEAQLTKEALRSASGR